MRTLVLVDGEHFPPVVSAAIDTLPCRIPGCVVVGAALLGGTEKLRGGPPALGVPLVGGPTPDDALVVGLARFALELVFDLSDELVVDDRSRLRLACRVLAAGAAYQGADFRFDPPPRPTIATKPTVAVIGTGKRTGKTAVCAHLARVLAANGRPPVIVAMSRGGPAEPELVDPSTADLSVAGLLALADAGRHAASDHLEDALVARLATVGTRRCGGGLAGAPFDDTFAAGVRLADARHEELLLLEGSGRAIPPVHADVTVCVVPADADPELVTGYAGAFRLLLSDVVVITLAEASIDQPLPDGMGDRVGTALERSIRALVPGARVITTVFWPVPVAPIDGRRIVFATTAPPRASDLLRSHLEANHGCTVVGMTHHLAEPSRLRADLEAMGEADILVVELKAAAIDVAARFGVERGMEVVFCDNRVVSIAGGEPFDELASAVADLAVDRNRTRRAASVSLTQP
ncbi:cyclic 2,3-diphosphoglycerate synthase [soil metagenome]